MNASILYDSDISKAVLHDGYQAFGPLLDFDDATQAEQFSDWLRPREWDILELPKLREQFLAELAVPTHMMLQCRRCSSLFRSGDLVYHRPGCCTSGPFENQYGAPATPPESIDCCPFCEADASDAIEVEVCDFCEEVVHDRADHVHLNEEMA